MKLIKDKCILDFILFVKQQIYKNKIKKKKKKKKFFFFFI